MAPAISYRCQPESCSSTGCCCCEVINLISLNYHLLRSQIRRYINDVFRLAMDAAPIGGGNSLSLGFIRISTFLYHSSSLWKRKRSLALRPTRCIPQEAPRKKELSFFFLGITLKLRCPKQWRLACHCRGRNRPHKMRMRRGQVKGVKSWLERTKSFKKPVAAALSLSLDPAPSMQETTAFA